MSHCTIKLVGIILYTDYERDAEDNPADFFLDTIITNEVTIDMAKQEGVCEILLSLSHTLVFKHSLLYRHREL